MKTQSMYAPYLDLAWYKELNVLFAQKERYGIDLPKHPVVITEQELQEALEKPKALPLGKQRALALAATGTDFETGALNELIEGRALEGDVFFGVAYCNAKKKPKADWVLRELCSQKEDDLEANLFALRALDGYTNGYARVLLPNVIWCMKGNVEFFENNPIGANWLLEFNKASTIKSDFLASMMAVVQTVPDTTAKVYDVLFEYKYTVVSALSAAYFVRNGCDRYERGWKRTQALKELLGVELAKTYKTWNDLEKRLVVELFKGSLGEHIISTKNYEWYYRNLGFHLPELLINTKDEIAVEQLVPVLSDVDRCRVAAQLDLPKKSVKAFKLKFSEWAPELQEYYEKVGSVKRGHEFYTKVHEPLSVDDTAELISAKWKCFGEHCDGISEDNAVEFAVKVADVSMPVFQEVVQRFGIRDALPEEFKELYRQWRMCSMRKDCSKQEFGQVLSVNETEYPNLSDIPGYQELRENYDVSWGTYNRFIGEASEDPEQLFQILVDCSECIDVMERFILDGCAITELPKYAKSLKELTANEKTLRIVLSGENGRKFREWAGVSAYECHKSMERVSGIFSTLGASSFTMTDEYRETMGGVIGEWIRTGSPLAEYNTRFNLPECYNREWTAIWIKRAEKRYSESGSIAGVSPVTGRIGKNLFLYTDKGLILLEGGSVDIGIPVWSLSDSADAEEFVIGGVNDQDGLYVRDLGFRIRCNVKVKLNAKRV